MKNIRLRRVATATLGALMMAATLSVATPGVAHAYHENGYHSGCPEPNSGDKVSCQVGAPYVDGAVNYCTPDHLDIVVCVKYDGDHVYVADMARDGNSAVAILYREDGGGWDRVCRNKSGAYNWVDCNFNWDEGYKWYIYGYTFDQYDSKQTWAGYWKYYGYLGVTGRA